MADNPTSILVKRPVAFRIPRMDAETAGTTLSKTEWRYFTDEVQANEEAEQLGVEYQSLYVRDGTAIVAEWEPVASAPTDGPFLVCAVGDDRGPFVVNAQIFWSARKKGTPSHLGLSHLTHWMPLPALPSSSSKSDAPSEGDNSPHHRRSVQAVSGRPTVTLYVPAGYADADEFLKDCQFERADDGVDRLRVQNAARLKIINQKLAIIDDLRAELADDYQRRGGNGRPSTESMCDLISAIIQDEASYDPATNKWDTSKAATAIVAAFDGA